MSVGEKLKVLMLASLAFSLAFAANAAVDDDADATDSSIIGNISNLGSDPTPCVDLNTDCSILMVNYYGDSVEFALFRRGSLEDTSYKDYSTDYDRPNNQARTVKDLPGGEKVESDNNEKLLRNDFLRGFEDKGYEPVIKDGFSGKEDGPAGGGGMHDWAFAAVTSMDYHSQQSNPGGITVPIHFDEGSPTFWDFEHVYQWEVEENVLASGRYNISQVALSDIYLSPKKTNSSSDPEIVVCDQNDPNNCRPLSD